MDISPEQKAALLFQHLGGDETTTITVVDFTSLLENLNLYDPCTNGPGQRLVRRLTSYGSTISYEDFMELANDADFLSVFALDNNKSDDELVNRALEMFDDITGQDPGATIGAQLLARIIEDLGAAPSRARECATMVVPGNGRLNRDQLEEIVSTGGLDTALYNQESENRRLLSQQNSSSSTNAQDDFPVPLNPWKRALSWRRTGSKERSSRRGAIKKKNNVNDSSLSRGETTTFVTGPRSLSVEHPIEQQTRHRQGSSRAAANNNNRPFQQRGRSQRVKHALSKRGLRSSPSGTPLLEEPKYMKQDTTRGEAVLREEAGASNERLSHIKALYNLVADTEDGMLSEAGFYELMQDPSVFDLDLKVKDLTPEFCRDIFTKIDTDESGAISFNEFAAALVGKVPNDCQSLSEFPVNKSLLLDAELHAFQRERSRLIHDRNDLLHYKSQAQKKIEEERSMHDSRLEEYEEQMRNQSQNYERKIKALVEKNKSLSLQLKEVIEESALDSRKETSKTWNGRAAGQYFGDIDGLVLAYEELHKKHADQLEKARKDAEALAIANASLEHQLNNAHCELQAALKRLKGLSALEEALHERDRLIFDLQTRISELELECQRLEHSHHLPAAKEDVLAAFAGASESAAKNLKEECDRFLESHANASKELQVAQNALAAADEKLVKAETQFNEASAQSAEKVDTDSIRVAGEQVDQAKDAAQQATKLCADADAMGAAAKYQIAALQARQEAVQRHIPHQRRSSVEDVGKYLTIALLAANEAITSATGDSPLLSVTATKTVRLVSDLERRRDALHTQLMQLHTQGLQKLLEEARSKIADLQARLNKPQSNVDDSNTVELLRSKICKLEAEMARLKSLLAGVDKGSVDDDEVNRLRLKLGDMAKLLENAYHEIEKLMMELQRQQHEPHQPIPGTQRFTWLGYELKAAFSDPESHFWRRVMHQKALPVQLIGSHEVYDAVLKITSDMIVISVDRRESITIPLEFVIQYSICDCDIEIVVGSSENERAETLHLCIHPQNIRSVRAPT